jgi:hypothetical protein
MAAGLPSPAQLGPTGVERGGGVAEASWLPRLQPVLRMCHSLPPSASPQTSPGASGGGQLRPQSLLGCLSNLSVSLPAQVGAAGEEQKGRGGGLPRPQGLPGCNLRPAATATFVRSTLRRPLRHLRHSHARPLRPSSTACRKTDHTGACYHPPDPLVVAVDSPALERRLGREGGGGGHLAFEAVTAHPTRHRPARTSYQSRSGARLLPPAPDPRVAALELALKKGGGGCSLAVPHLSYAQSPPYH